MNAAILSLVLSLLPMPTAAPSTAQEETSTSARLPADAETLRLVHFDHRPAEPVDGVQRGEVGISSTGAVLGIDWTSETAGAFHSMRLPASEVVRLFRTLEVECDWQAYRPAPSTPSSALIDVWGEYCRPERYSVHQSLDDAAPPACLTVLEHIRDIQDRMRAPPVNYPDPKTRVTTEDPHFLRILMTRWHIRECREG